MDHGVYALDPSVPPPHTFHELCQCRQSAYFSCQLDMVSDILTFALTLDGGSYVYHYIPPQDVTQPSLIALETFSGTFPWIDRSRERSENMVIIEHPPGGLVLTSLTFSVFDLISQAFLLFLSRAVAVQLPRR